MLLTDNNSYLLAVESSCDETSAAVLRGGREVLSNVISSQIDIHQKYKGVVPEIASRCHTQCIAAVTQEAILQAGIDYHDLSGVAVTAGPGLIGGLLVGVAFAKALAFTIEKPLIGVHHIEGHICANFISHPELEPPFLALVVSGGHSHIVLCEDYCKYKLLGHTRDDAAGEAFDKVARILGLPYPGGVHIDRLAPLGNPTAFDFHSALMHQDHYDFSFSGIKTNIINLVHKLEQNGESVPVEDIAASFQRFVCTCLCDKTIKAALASEINLADNLGQQGKPGHKSRVNKVVLAGGVAANSELRSMLAAACAKNGLEFYCPETVLCTDNAAMIGCAGYFRLLMGQTSPLSLNAEASMSLF